MGKWLDLLENKLICLGVPLTMLAALAIHEERRAKEYHKDEAEAATARLNSLVQQIETNDGKIKVEFKLSKEEIAYVQQLIADRPHLLHDALKQMLSSPSPSPQ